MGTSTSASLGRAQRAHTPTDYEIQMEFERGRWLRIRFLWFSALGSLLALLGEARAFPSLSAGGRPALKALISVSGATFCAMLYIAAFLYGRRVSPNRKRIVALALWLNALVGSVELIYSRGALQVDAPGTHSLLVDWAWTVPILIFMDHFLACLLIPWTWKECLAPPAIMVAVGGGIFACDAWMGAQSASARARTPIFHLAALLLIASVVAVIPGVLVCLIRYSRWRKTFRMKFESTAWRKMQSELSGARRLLESCLPPEWRAGPVRVHYVYEPMREIGGDLLFVHPSAELEVNGVASVVVLDVSGHGIAAALTVSRLVGELERIFGENPAASPSEVLQSLNRYASLTLMRHAMFVTGMCLRADVKAGTLEWANAGHPPALLRRAGGAIESLDPTTYVLGVVDSGEFGTDVGRTTFERGDSVIAYTDGASEAAAPDGQMLGTEGVERLVRELRTSSQTSDWASALADRVCSHRSGPPLDDTLLVVVSRPAEP